MNQGGTTDTLATQDPNSVEKYQVVNPSQPPTSSYYAPSGSSAMSWSTHGANNYSRDNGIVSNSTYHHDQQGGLTSRNVQEGLNVTPVASTSSSGSANVPQDCGGYTTYPSTDPYGYGNTGYAAYYSGYQQQTSQLYPPPPGAYQHSGAPYQPISSFQNTGSYAGSASYSSTYYNPGDYQTTGVYQNSTYSNQTNYWLEGQYPTYTSHQYPSYTPDSTTAYSSSSAVATSQYGQHYKQWADYYNQTEVSCAPGTENVSVSGVSNLGWPGPGVTSGYQASNNQQTAPYSQAWRPEASSSEFPSNQPATASHDVHDGYWKPGSAVIQNQNLAVQQHVQTPLDTNPTYENFQNQQTSIPSQGLNSLYPASHQLSQSYQPSSQTVSQAVPPVDSIRISKFQIPTNPRIAPNLALGSAKTDKDSSTSTGAAKPAYISVSLPKSNDKVPSNAAADDSILKPGTFPKSLRGYVERALARCKNDHALSEASQAIMKEIITKATVDGTLYTRDWDTEPLFPLPNLDIANKEGLLLLTSTSSLQKSKRSPSRRSKSRWEPIPEEKLDKPTSVIRESVKYGGWNKQFTTEKLDNKEDHLSTTKFSLSNQKIPNNSSLRPAKRQRVADGLNAADNGDASSDSDGEQNLTAYYSAAVALADSPEERKRRENRSKRFEKGPGNRAEKNHLRLKSAGTGNLYARRASAVVLNRNLEDSGSKAVEDIDWDALTVKGTCQEIEKRYLRLTSAPDPATVRPEEVLEKALLMVQSSDRNYLYKCDQLKSIRQDLTVQRIRNELTVKVYETHARLAIEVGDLPEYNQCQSQLKILYSEGITGCHMEFAAYNLLCVILHCNNNRDLLSAMSRLPAEARNNDAVKHALAVRAAVTSGNYVLFFRLYKTAPNLNTYLMDLYVEKMRYAAVRCMSRSYRPTVPVSYVSVVLGFTSVLPITDPSDEKDVEGMEECIEWLKAHGACLAKDNSGEMLLDTKLSMSTLYMPEPEDAVAHGDATLAVDDFLARNPA